MGLVIYIKPNCPYCQQARDYYTSQGVEWTEYDAQNDRIFVTGKQWKKLYEIKLKQ